MSESSANLRRKINGAQELDGVVRTMKVLAASNIANYEKAVQSLGDYYHTVELGLAVCLRQLGSNLVAAPEQDAGETVGLAIVFGSDQGLVGPFNDLLADFTLNLSPGNLRHKKIWAVGERVSARLEDLGMKPEKIFDVPNSVNNITPLVGQVLIAVEAECDHHDFPPMYLIHNRPGSMATYDQVGSLLLPLDREKQNELLRFPWPTGNQPEVFNDFKLTLRTLIREYLFISLFRACAESLASENAARLAAMQRAEKNIDELLEELRRTFHHLRQSAIDEELFDVIAGAESLDHECQH